MEMTGFMQELYTLTACLLFDRSTQRFILCNIYSFQISILLTFSQNRIYKIVYFKYFVFLACYTNTTKVINMSLIRINSCWFKMKWKYSVTLLLLCNCTYNIYIIIRKKKLFWSLHNFNASVYECLILQANWCKVTGMIFLCTLLAD